MSTGIFTLPAPVNEPVHDYAPGSPERASIEARLRDMAAHEVEIPMLIGGREVRSGKTGRVVAPHDHDHVLATFHQGGEEEARQAVAAAADARREWAATPWESRAAVFLRAAELLSGPWRDVLNAATMLGQSKTVYQAEIDAAAELIDFWRFNVSYMHRLMQEQPLSSRGVWNRVEYRPLEGFVFAVAPFNFTSIAGNLPTAPALMGNTVLFKPASTAVLSAYYIMRLLEEAGLPPGVINMLLGSGADIGDPVLSSPELAGIHFTGSTATFQRMWKTVGASIDRYHAYPRLVGETGGKDFIVAHASADADAVTTAIVRGAFEYQGQKCSAASRVYVASNVWGRMRERLEREVGEIPMGDVRDFGNFMGAVIDGASFRTQAEAIELARRSDGARVLVGGGYDDSTGYFVQPTVVVTEDPSFELMRRELFGPVVTVYVYDEHRFDDALELVDSTSPYGLTGAVFASERSAIDEAARRLVNAAGNFYVNDKPTGAVVGQQPFGGARASGTNDKAGSMWNLIRWVSPRSIKETFVPATDYRYPYMGDGGGEQGAI